MLALQETVHLELAAHGVPLVILLRQALWHGLQAMLPHISGVLVLLLHGGVEATSAPSCPHRCPKRSQPVSHVFNVAAARETTPAERMSQLSRALPVCCKVTGFSLEPLQLPVLQEQGGCSSLSISSSTGATTARRAGPRVSGMIQASVFWIERPNVFPFTRTSTPLHSSVGPQTNP